MTTAGGSFKGGFFGCFGAVAAIIVLGLAALILPSLMRQRSGSSATSINDVTPFCRVALAVAVDADVDVDNARIGPAQPYRMAEHATCFFEHRGDQITLRITTTCATAERQCVRLNAVERSGEVIYPSAE